MAKEKRLGKGLSAIFGDDIDAVLEDIANNESDIKGQKSSLDLNSIRPNPYQPRKVFDEEALKELAESIKEHGVFQPILVRKAISGYELIAGERRLRASKMAGLETIPAIILDFNDQEMMEISLLENIQREDLSIIEEAKAYEKLIENLHYTQEELAKRVAKSRSYITNTLRLLKLSDEVQELLNNKSLSYGHARALINIEDENSQVELAKRAVKEGLTVREIEKLAKAKKDKPVKKKDKDPYFEDVRHRLEEKLSTSVDITSHNLNIHYRDVDDLNRILEILDCVEDFYDEK